uniref:Breast cancer type 2 susceptibility-like protein n=1 Tax=Magallana gigas TaxID=29159 RepID=K1RH48_MAGGI
MEAAVGPSSEDWFQVATTQKLQAKQREKEERSLFMSPVSQCSSQLTPDILKFHRGGTYESSPEISTFERLLSSQSSTSSPHSRWLHPSLGSSPQDGGRDQNLASEEAIIRSLGISADDSGISWTSSLATPSHPLSPTGSGVKQDVNEDQLPEKRKQKRVPRALFSPGVVRNPDELCHSLNKSDIEIKVEPDEDTVKEGASKEIHVLDISVKSEVETDSMQLFSQELITEEPSLENDVVYLGEKSLSTKKDNCASADETTAAAIKQEVIDETLSDFFDPPSKSVGRRRCAPSKGRKRKSLGDSPLGFDFPFKREAKALVSSSPSLSPVAGARRVLKAAKEKFNTPVERNKPPRSILSNEKCRGSKSGTRKRVTFSNSDDFFKGIDPGKEEGGNSNKQLKKTEDVDINVSAQIVESLKSRDFDSCDQTKVQSVDVTVEDSEDLFSQVSPSSLNEMCSIDNEDLFAKDINSSSSKKNDDHGKILNSVDAVEPMGTNGNNKNTAVHNDTQKQHSSDEVPSKAEISPIVPKISGLRSKGRKFLYPTTNQITKSCPKVVYGFKEVESPFHNQHTISESPTLEKNDEEPTAGQGIDNKSRETKSPKVSSTTGFQRFSKLEPADNQREGQNPQHIKEESEVQPSTSMCGSSSKTFGGFSTAGGRKFVMDKDALQKARSLLEKDYDNDLDNGVKKLFEQGEKAVENVDHRLDPISLPSTGSKECSSESIMDGISGKDGCSFQGFQTARGKKVECSESSLKKAQRMILEEGATNETERKECTIGSKADWTSSSSAGFQGFQTASGKKVECSESSLEKAQRMITEEGDTKKISNTETEWDDIESVMPSGDKKSAAKGQEIGFSSVKEFINPGLKSSKYTALSSGSKSTDFQTKGKNIFSDIFEEFQDCGGNIDADSIPGFKTAGGKGFNSSSSCLKNTIPTNNKKGSKEPNEESVDSVVEEDIIKSMFSGIKGKVGNNSNTKPVGPSTFTRPVNTAQQMKSASIAARFPPGSNIPKGFRPFKPPKIAPKAKPHIPTASDVVSKTTVNKSESVQEIQPHSNEGSRDEEKNVNENFCNKENDKMDDSADLSNLFLNDMFEEEMEISQKLTPEPVANSGKIIKEISEESIERVKENVCCTSTTEKAEETTEKSLNGGPSAKMPAEMVDVLQHKFDGFQTASGKAVSIDEESLKKAKELWDNQTTGNDDKDTYPEISDSEKEDNIHTSHVEEKMKEKPVQYGGFQTASGKHVTVSGKAMVEGKKLWKNSLKEDGHPSISPLQSTKDNVQLPENENKKEKVSFSGFQTASGKTVKVDDKSLTEARKLWSSSGVEERVTPTHTVLENLCQPDNFSQNNVKEKNELSSTYDEKTLQDSKEKPKNQIVPQLSSSSDMKSNVSSLSSMGEKKMVNYINIQSGCPLAFQSPFMSASGKKIQVSEEALNHVKLETLKTEEGKENEKPAFQTDETKPVRNISASMSCPFFSASGKQISVSASALESTKSFFDDNEKDFSSLTTDSKKFSPFQSASGKSVSVSKKSLEIARAILEEDHEMKTLHTAATTSLPNETHSKEKSFSPFESASGKKVLVSQKSLEMARAKLEDNQGPEKQTSTPKISKVDYMEGDILPFQSASGKSVSVSKKSLEKARARLMENFEADVDTLPTSSADTPSTSSRQETDVVFPAHSQKRKLDEIKTPKKQKTREVEDANEYENLILPDDFFDEMETPNKKIKMENGTASKTIPGHVGNDRQNFTALSTVPEGYTKDRQNFYANPLKCQSARDSGSSHKALVKQEEAKKQNTPSAATASGSSFRTPYKAGSTSTESQSQPNSMVKSVQPVFVPKSKQQAHPASSLDVKSGSKTVSKNLGPAVSSSLSTSPQNGNSKQDMTQKTTKSDKEKEEYKKALETGRGKQEEMVKSKSSCSVKPSAGRLFQLKTSGTRCKLREVIFGQQQNKTDVYVGDGALLVPDDQGYTGVKELYKAFLTIDSVDPSLISEAWFCNHYRWIVWKLASYEVASPDKFGSRSALRKIMERDDTSSKRLVLCVSSVQRAESTNPATPSSKQTVLDPEVTVELSDGWYCIPAKLDVPLLDLINRRRIQTGHKLCTTGAELVGSQDPCTPLEAPASLQLKINANSTRPVPWDTVLGFQPDPRPLCVPLSDLHGEGGMVGCVDVVLGRKYPLMYMEKLPDGGSVFRTAQAEEKFSQLYQKQQQDAMESLYRKLEKDFDKEDYEESRAVKRQWKESEIEELQSGQEVWEALRTAKRPDIVEGYLSDSQMRSLMDYKQQLHQEKLQRLQNEFQKSWSDEQGNSKARNVVPLLKLRVMGLSKKDVDSGMSTVISVWRPGQEVLDLKEGQRYRVFSLSASHSRARYSPNSVQLTANRQTKFLPVRVDENLLDLVYEPREVLCACDLKRRQPMFGEVDIVCLIVNIEVTEAGESSRNQEIVYGMDKNGDILGIKFWGGLKAFGLNATLTVGTVVCGSNLQDKFPQRSTILPLVEASMEFSVFTKTPQGALQKKAHQVLTERIKTAGEKTLVERGQQLVAELLEKRRKMTLGHTPTKTVCSEQGEENASPVPPSSAQKAKIAQLMSYGSPSPLSPIPTKVTPAAKKNFKVPKPAHV